jgi:hypothetical protein
MKKVVLWLTSERCHENVPVDFSRLVKHKTSGRHRKSFLWSCCKYDSFGSFPHKFWKTILTYMNERQMNRRLHSNNRFKRFQFRLTSKKITGMMLDDVPTSYTLLIETSIQSHFRGIALWPARWVILERYGRNVLMQTELVDKMSFREMRRRKPSARWVVENTTLR